MILVSYNISTNSFFTVFSNKKRLTLAYLSDHLFTPAYKNSSRLIRLERVIIKPPGQFSTSNIHPFSTTLSLVQPSSSPLSTQQYSGLHADAFTRNHPHSRQNPAALPLWCSKWAVAKWLLSNQTAQLEQSVLLMYVSCNLVFRSQREHFNQCKKNFLSLHPSSSSDSVTQHIWNLLHLPGNRPAFKKKSVLLCFLRQPNNLRLNVQAGDAPHCW